MNPHVRRVGSSSFTPIIVALISAVGVYLAAHRDNIETREEMRALWTASVRHSDSLHTVTLAERQDRRVLRRLRIGGITGASLFVGPAAPTEENAPVVTRLWRGIVHLFGGR